jgi:DNA-binding CsgD family transcriptional regulator
VTVFLFIVIAINMLLFAGLGLWVWTSMHKDDSPRIRVLSAMLAVVALAFVLGAATRLISVAVRMGWLDGRVGDFIASEWHLIQSLASTALGVVGFLLVRRYGKSLKTADRIATAVSNRLFEGSSLTEYGFTNREIEVLRAIADGYISDNEIAEILFIAPATAATHVKNILKKSGVRSRRELALLISSSNL